MPDIVFKNVPNIGDLTLDKALFTYEIYDMVFICKDKLNNRYLCICTDIIEMYSWMIVKISIEDIANIVYNKIKIINIFESSTEKIILANLYFDKPEEFVYRVADYRDIIKDDLPADTSYLGTDGNFNDYRQNIREIQNESV